ncbi:MAG TPA: hypothetical protein VFH95_06100 [Candidatus Kapabacteria bacterium]|nr:hypothetical protein [Candidatus Kapabacteria bacterium]
MLTAGTDEGVRVRAWELGARNYLPGTPKAGEPFFLSMQTYRTEATINNEGKIILSLPFKKSEKVAVVVTPFNDAQEALDEEAWIRLGLEHFFKDDAEGDTAYDLL